MPRGALAQYLRALFGQKENFNVYFSGKRRSLLHLNTAQRSFFPITMRVYRIVLMPPGKLIQYGRLINKKVY